MLQVVRHVDLEDIQVENLNYQLDLVVERNPKDIPEKDLNRPLDRFQQGRRKEPEVTKVPLEHLKDQATEFRHQEDIPVADPRSQLEDIHLQRLREQCLAVGHKDLAVKFRDLEDIPVDLRDQLRLVQQGIQAEGLKEQEIFLMEDRKDPEMDFLQRDIPVEDQKDLQMEKVIQVGQTDLKSLQWE